MNDHNTGLERPFTKLLIANRGEIACRIIRTASRMGLQTVAVFSAADQDCAHVSLADEAILIGGPTASDSYLRIDRVMDAAKRTGAQAIHPGYGFLSENEDFARACRDAGIIFIGPSVEAIHAMASKSAAKALMEKSGVPLVPGYHGDNQDAAHLAATAAEIGYPVLIKASAGGGGKGMRIVETAEQFAAMLGAAKREAMASFGNDHVLIEKFIQRPRHIEVQVFGDTHGNVVSLFERECTLQRRHQKVIEEAPSSTLSEAERERICAAARAAAAAVNYTGAGTVEFVANQDGFYFIEMNTRLQVEHPVTEAITGLDLVEWQIRVAFGEPLPKQQQDITRSGHAVEVRIYAEDPDNGFLPSTGRLDLWHQPQGEGIRIDSGFRQGDQISHYYDPMIAKLIVSGADRAQALHRMGEALKALQISGLRTNVAFLRRLVAHPDIHAGQMDTGFIERELSALLSVDDQPTAFELAGAVAAVLAREITTDPSPWGQADGWMMAGQHQRKMTFDKTAVTLTYTRDGMLLTMDGQASAFRFRARADGRLDIFYGDRKEIVSAAWMGRMVEISTSQSVRKLHYHDPFAGETSAQDGVGHVKAPMPGAIQQILAIPGTKMLRGEPILIMEAMKMEHVIRAPANGTLIALDCAIGDFVNEGIELVHFEEEAA